MVPFWFTLSALCFVGAAVLLYIDIGRRRGLGRRRGAPKERGGKGAR